MTKHGLTFGDKPPGDGAVVVGGVVDADARGGGVGELGAVVFDPEVGGGREVDIVQGLGDFEGFGQFAGAGVALDAANQGSLGVVFRPGNDVKQIMDAVTEVNVGAAAGLVKDFGTLGSAGAGVAGGVFLAVVGLGFGDSKF